MHTSSWSFHVVLGLALATLACTSAPHASRTEPCNHYVPRPDSVRDSLWAPLNARSLCGAAPNAQWRLTLAGDGHTAPHVSYTLYALTGAADSIAWRVLTPDSTQIRIDSGGFRIARRDAQRIGRLLGRARFVAGPTPPLDCPGCVIECTRCAKTHAEVRDGDDVLWFIRPGAAPPFPALSEALQVLVDSLARDRGRRTGREAR